MNLHITTVDFDLNGYVTINPTKVERGNFARRSTKRKTLDGGVASYDGGFSHGDQTLEYEFRPTQEQDEALRYIIEYHREVYISNKEGFYKVIPSYRPGYDTATFVASILEKIA